jgi:hypothetical protein
LRVWRGSESTVPASRSAAICGQPGGPTIAVSARTQSGSVGESAECPQREPQDLPGRAASGEEWLADPELIEDDAPLRVVLIVADAARDDVDLPQRVERNDRRLVDDLAIEASPELVCEVRVGRLQLECALNVGVDLPVAELGEVRRRTTRKEGGDVVRRRREIGEPGVRSCLHAASWIKRTAGAVVHGVTDALDTRAVAEAAEKAGAERASPRWLSGTQSVTVCPSVPEAATSRRARSRSGASHLPPALGCSV